MQNLKKIFFNWFYDAICCDGYTWKSKVCYWNQFTCLLLLLDVSTRMFAVQMAAILSWRVQPQQLPLRLSSFPSLSLDNSLQSYCLFLLISGQSPRSSFKEPGQRHWDHRMPTLSSFEPFETKTQRIPWSRLLLDGGGRGENIGMWRERPSEVDAVEGKHLSMPWW